MLSLLPFPYPSPPPTLTHAVEMIVRWVDVNREKLAEKVTPWAIGSEEKDVV